MTIAAALDALVINTPLDFAHALEAIEGWPQTSENDGVLVAWQQAEGLGSFAYRNPLNTTQKEPGATYGQGKVAHYPDWATGLKGAVDALNSGSGQWYANVRNDLASSAPPEQTAHDITASSWAGGHYGALPPDFGGGNIERILGSPGWTPSSATVPAGSSSSSGQLTGFDWNPANWWGDITGGVKGDVAKIVLTGTFLAGGATLVVLGAWRSVSADTRQSIKSGAALAAVA